LDLGIGGLKPVVPRFGREYNPTDARVELHVACAMDASPAVDPGRAASTVVRTRLQNAVVVVHDPVAE
jgi:hypothetical protein